MYLPVESLVFKADFWLYPGRQADAICIIKIIFFFFWPHLEFFLGLLGLTFCIT
jgi:hypothetical protein